MAGNDESTMNSITIPPKDNASLSPVAEMEKGIEKVREPTTADQKPPATEVDGKGDVPAPPSKLKVLWDEVGLDLSTVLIMFKGSVAPIIGISIYQANSVPNIYHTIGYLVPIAAVLSVSFLPRAKFLQIIVLDVFAVCLATAISLLGLWSAIQARKHTTPPGDSKLYNSSQSVVCAIWLFATIYLANVVKAKAFALQFPATIFCIICSVALTYGPIFATMDQAEQIVTQLLEAFLTAFAIAVGVNLFIIPITSRTVVFKETTGYIMSLRKLIKAEAAYLRSLERSDMFAPVEEQVGGDQGGKNTDPVPSAETKALKASVAGMKALHGKMHADLGFAKREIGWGKLGPEDLDAIFQHFRKILVPIVAIGTVTDIFERIAERRGWTDVAPTEAVESWEVQNVAKKTEEKQAWNEIMKAMHEPFEVAFEALDQALEHAGYVLELIPKPKRKGKTRGEDVEATGDEIKPGDSRFTKYLEQRLKELYSTRGSVLRGWARSKGLASASVDTSSGLPNPNLSLPLDEAQHQRDQQQLFLILFLEQLLYCAGIAILDFVQFADKKVEDGTMKRKRLILPGLRRIRKWIMNIGREDTNIDHNSPESLESSTQNVYMGAGFSPRKDPEHLPPTNAWERFGNAIRAIPKFFGSPESAFGLRAACATLSIGIVAFLESTFDWFIKERVVWALIIIAISMTMTSGQSFFGLFARLTGTFIAAVLSIAIWYIPDQHIAGVIVILWLFIFLHMYCFIKFPRFMALWIVTIVTLVLTIGYELQVRKIGEKAATATGQPFYPIYLLAPYRLAAVAAGSFVAFVWTIFPYPISDRSWLRKDLGATLHLLANYYNVVHSTISARLHDTEGDMSNPQSPGRRLEKIRNKIFGKLLLLIPSLHQHADWQKWELSLGGKFPTKTYDAITQRANNILSYLTLVAYATETWTTHEEQPFPDNESRRAWLTDLTSLVDIVNPTSHQIISVLSLLAASVRDGTPLPPYMAIPQPYNLNQRLEALDKGILDARHMQDLGYSTYAVLQVASGMLVDDLAKMMDDVRDLVGETDFSFRVPMSDASSSVDTNVGSSQRRKID